MPDVKASALITKGDTNGLAAIAGQLCDEGMHRRPRRAWGVLGIVDCRRVNVDADSGDEVATVRFRRVEVLLLDDLPAAEKLMRRALEHRTGQTTLPLELEDEIRELFAEMSAPDDADDPDEDGDASGDDPPGDDEDQDAEDGDSGDLFGDDTP